MRTCALTCSTIPIFRHEFIVFSGEYHKNKILIDTWYQKARETKELCSEQTSLARMLLAYRPDIYDNFNTIKTISIDNTEVKINILPTSIYNFSSIEKYLNTPDDRIKVLHFKNSRFKTPMFAEIAKQLDMK